MKKWYIKIIVNIAVFCTLLVFLELAGQIFYYFIHGKFIFQVTLYDNPRDRYYHDLFELHPFYAVRLKKNVKVENHVYKTTITTTNERTRWTGAPEDDSNLIRVAVLGGSTTFGTGVSDRDTWPALLQAKLGNKFSVINYGLPSVTTTEAIVQLALDVPEIKPQFVILYEGWNDIWQYHDPEFSPDYYSHGLAVQDRLEIQRYKEKTLFEKLYEISAIVRLASNIKGKLSQNSGNYPCITYSTPDPYVDRIYVRNLKTLKLLSENIANYTLFVPQILNYDKFMENNENLHCNSSGSSDYGSSYIKNSAMPQLMDRFNSLMRPICGQNDSKCIFADSVLKVKWEPDDFNDLGHFTRKGDEKFADVISRVILSKLRPTSNSN